MHLLRAIECSGNESSISTTAFVTEYGGKVICLCMGKYWINIPFMHFAKHQIDIVFSYAYCNVYQRVIDLIAQKKYDVQAMISHRFQLEDAVKAFVTAGDLSSGAVKVQIFA